MSSGATPPAEQPSALVEYEFTDDLACQMALTLSSAIKMPRRRRLLLVGSLLLFVGLFWTWRPLGRYPLAERILVVGGVVMQILLVLGVAALFLLPRLLRPLYRWAALRGARHLPHRHVRWAFFDDRFETQTANTHRKVLWSDLRQLRLFCNFWMLTLKSRRILLLPVSALSPDVQSLIQRKATDGGAAIECTEQPTHGSAD